MQLGWIPGEKCQAFARVSNGVNYKFSKYYLASISRLSLLPAMPQRADFSRLIRLAQRSTYHYLLSFEYEHRRHTLRLHRAIQWCCNPLLDCFLCDSRSLLLAALCLFWPYMGPWGPPLARCLSQPIATLQQMEQASETPRQLLLASLRGQSFALPDLHKFMEHWPQYINHEIECLRENIDCKLQKFVPFSSQFRSFLG